MCVVGRRVTNIRQNHKYKALMVWWIEEMEWFGVVGGIISTFPNSWEETLSKIWKCLENLVMDLCIGLGN